MNFRVDLDIFRGPLDLLLYLVRKHELEVVDIPIAPITDQFQQEMDAIQRDLKTARRELKKMYRENALYIRSIEEYSDGAVKSML